jgi:sec-independent protein translocase protein TatA
MGPLSWPEILIILVVLLLLFGAKRLPEMGRSLGRGMREFKDAVTGNEEPPKQPEQLSAMPTPAPAPTAPQPAETPAQPNSERVSSS